MAEKKECENCKHGDVYFKDEPCRSCDEHYSLWESLTYTPPDTAPPDELDKDAKVNGMDELKIYRFQALHIEDTFRIVANILKSRSKETCIDRQICKSIEMINGILNKR